MADDALDRVLGRHHAVQGPAVLHPMKDVFETVTGNQLPGIAEPGQGGLMREGAFRPEEGDRALRHDGGHSAIDLLEDLHGGVRGKLSAMIRDGAPSQTREIPRQHLTRNGPQDGRPLVQQRQQGRVHCGDPFFPIFDALSHPDPFPWGDKTNTLSNSKSVRFKYGARESARGGSTGQGAALSFPTTRMMS